VEEVVLAGRLILLVEDEPLIRIDACDLLRAAGATVFPASGLEDGLRWSGHPDLSAGVLDFRLSNSDSSAICWKLTDRGIPFMFHTAARAREFAQWPLAPVLIKPTTHRLVAMVAGFFR
jgi:CheY-like chemotaxis protein